MLKKAVRQVSQGIEIDSLLVYARETGGGRFEEEVDLELFMRKGDRERYLLHAKVYYGRKPHYTPWVGLSHISDHIDPDNGIQYFCSKIEDRLLELLATALGPGQKIHIEYQADRETSFGLRYDFPAPVTRLGHKMLNLGFTWFKDWYFPEGGKEGGQKLQGEKPLDSKAEGRHLRAIKKEISSFLRSVENGDTGVDTEQGNYLLRASDRARSILVQIEKHFAREGLSQK